MSDNRINPNVANVHQNIDPQRPAVNPQSEENSFLKDAVLVDFKVPNAVSSLDSKIKTVQVDTNTAVVVNEHIRPQVIKSMDGNSLVELLNNPRIEPEDLPQSYKTYLKNNIRMLHSFSDKDFSGTENQSFRNLIGVKLYNSFTEELKNLQPDGFEDGLAMLMDKYSSLAKINCYFTNLIIKENKGNVNKDVIECITNNILNKGENLSELEKCYTQEDFNTWLNQHKDTFDKAFNSYIKLNNFDNLWKNTTLTLLKEATGLSDDTVLEYLDKTKLKNAVKEQVKNFISGKNSGDVESFFKKFVSDYLKPVADDIKLCQAKFGKDSELSLHLSSQLLKLSLSQNVIQKVIESSSGMTNVLKELNSPEDLESQLPVLEEILKIQIGNDEWQKLSADSRKSVMNMAFNIILDKNPVLKEKLTNDNNYINALKNSNNEYIKLLPDLDILNSTKKLMACLSNSKSDIPPQLCFALENAKKEISGFDNHSHRGMHELLNTRNILANDAHVYDLIADRIKSLNVSSLSTEKLNEITLDVVRNLAQFDVMYDYMIERGKNLGIGLNPKETNDKFLPFFTELLHTLIGDENSHNAIKNLKNKDELLGFVFTPENLNKYDASMLLYEASRREIIHMLESKVKNAKLKVNSTEIYRGISDDYANLSKKLIDNYNALDEKQRPLPNTKEFNTFINKFLEAETDKRISQLKTLDKMNLNGFFINQYREMAIKGQLEGQALENLQFARKFAHLAVNNDNLLNGLSPLGNGKNLKNETILSEISKFEQMLSDYVNNPDFSNERKAELKDMCRRCYAEMNPEFCSLVSKISSEQLEELRDSSETQNLSLGLIHSGRGKIAEDWIPKSHIEVIYKGGDSANEEFLEFVLTEGQKLFDRYKTGMSEETARIFKHIVGSLDYKHNSIQKLEAYLEKAAGVLRNWNNIDFSNNNDSLHQALLEEVKSFYETEAINAKQVNFVHKNFISDTPRASYTINGVTRLQESDDVQSEHIMQLLLKGRKFENLSPDEQLKLNKKKLAITSIAMQGLPAILYTFSGRKQPVAPGMIYSYMENESPLMNGKSYNDVQISISEDGQSCEIRYSKKFRVAVDTNICIPVSENDSNGYANLNMIVKLDLSGDEPAVADALMEQRLIGDVSDER